MLSFSEAFVKASKEKIGSYKLPVVPKQYYIELSEATESVNEMVRELSIRPLNIDSLNTRVDTARDLVLKLYNTTMNMVKTAKMAEMVIVYGNRYRNSIEEVDKELSDAEKMFYKGNYKEALDISIKATSRVDEKIYRKLVSVYEK